jgi:hypothetical protein
VSLAQPAEQTGVTLIDLRRRITNPRLAIVGTQRGHDEDVTIRRDLDFAPLADSELLEKWTIEDQGNTVSGSGQFLLHDQNNRDGTYQYSRMYVQIATRGQNVGPAGPRMPRAVHGANGPNRHAPGHHEHARSLRIPFGGWRSGVDRWRDDSHFQFPFLLLLSDNCLQSCSRSSPLNILRFLILAVAISMFSSHADAGFCWLPTDEQPTTADGLQVSDRRVAPIRKKLDSIEEVMRKNGRLQSLDQLRLRNSRYIGYPMESGGRTAAVAVNAYAPNSWSGECGLIRQAVQLRAAGVTVTLNTPGGIFGRHPAIKGEHLVAWAQPVATKSVGGRTLWDGERVVISRYGEKLWRPVTVAEYLDFKERELRSAYGDPAAAHAELEAMATPNEEGIRAMHAELAKVDPKQAKEFLATMEEHRKTMAAAAKDAQASLAGNIEYLRQQLAELEAFRRRSGAEGLAKQARVGNGPFMLAGEGGQPLVTMSESVSAAVAADNEVWVIVIHVWANRKEYLPALTSAFEAVEFDALEALLGR